MIPDLLAGIKSAGTIAPPGLTSFFTAPFFNGGVKDLPEIKNKILCEYPLSVLPHY
jgi:hypothetical protein